MEEWNGQSQHKTLSSESVLQKLKTIRSIQYLTKSHTTFSYIYNNKNIQKGHYLNNDSKDNFLVLNRKFWDVHQEIRCQIFLYLIKMHGH
jgi:hypothetical protein